jgi:Fic family protein
LILTRWNPVFKRVPVENIVYERQEDYYAAIRASTSAGDSAAFIEFMLSSILETLRGVS